jgi:hypothetical protein
MTAPVIDYLNPPPLPKTALTPGSTAHDVDGVVEILKLITDPSAHQKMLAEQQQIKAAWAEIARERRELRRAAALQADELAKIRAAFDAELATDRENHLAVTRAAEAALAAKCACRMSSTP